MTVRRSAPPFFAFPHHGGDRHASCWRSSLPARSCGVPGRLSDSGWFLRACQVAAPLGFIAVIAGWITTEVGRQPWTVYGVLRTADSVSPSLTGADVACSLALYVVVYLIMFPTGIAFMAVIVRRGPQRPRARRAGGAGRERPSRSEPFEAAARAAPRTANRRQRMVLDLVPIWTVLLGLAVFYYVVFDGFDLGVGILYGFVRDDASGATCDELDRADLGRQRDLAGARRHRLAHGGLSARLRDHHSGGVFSDPVMLLALVFRGVAFEFRFKQPSVAGLVGWRFCVRLCGGNLRARRRARRLHPGLQGRRPTLCRQLVRLAHAVRDR